MTRSEIDAYIDERIRATRFAWLRGAWKSWSVRWSIVIGTLIAAWPEIYPILHAEVLPLLSPAMQDLLVRFGGAIVLIVGILLRQRSKTSLVEKGKQ
jgi:hypothetical protein